MDLHCHILYEGNSYFLVRWRQESTKGLALARVQTHADLDIWRLTFSPQIRILIGPRPHLQKIRRNPFITCSDTQQNFSLRLTPNIIMVKNPGKWSWIHDKTRTAAKTSVTRTCHVLSTCKDLVWWWHVQWLLCYRADTHTHIHTHSHPYRADNRPIHAGATKYFDTRNKLTLCETTRGKLFWRLSGEIQHGERGYRSLVRRVTGPNAQQAAQWRGVIVQGNCPGRGTVKGRWYGVRARVVTLTLTITLCTCEWPSDTKFYYVVVSNKLFNV